MEQTFCVQNERRSIVSLAVLLGFFGAMLTLGTAAANTNIWNGKHDSNWTHKQNWGNLTLTTGDSIVFAGSTRTTNNNDENVGFNIAGITFNATAGHFELNGASIALSGTINNYSTNVQTINLGLILTNSSQIFNAQSNALIINGVISGATPQLGIIKNGDYQLTLGAQNTYSGGTTINAGTILLTGNGSLGLTNSSVSVSGGTLNLGGLSRTNATLLLSSGTLTNGTLTADSYQLSGGTIAANLGNGVMSVTSGHTTLSGTASAAVVNITGGILTLGGAGNRLTNTAVVSVSTSGTLDLGGFSQTLASLTGTGNVTNTAGVLELNISSGSNDAFNGTLQGEVSLAKSGEGSLTLGNSNTYSGGTHINAGTLNFSTNNALGSGSVSLGNGTMFTYIGGNSAIVSNSIILTNGIGTIGNTGGGSLTLAGALSHSGSILQFLGGAYNVTGQISGSSPNSGLLINRATVILAGSNTYNGPVYLTNGATLNANAAGAIPSAIRSALTISSNSIFQLGNSQVLASLSGAAGSAVTLGSSTLTIGSSGGSADYAGTITGTGGVTKDGTLAQLLSGASAYSGITSIYAGSLSLGSTGSLGGTAGVVVNTGSTFLLGSGTANRVATNASLILNGGSLSMGAASTRASSQQFSNLTLTANSVIDFANLSGNSALYFSTFSGLSSTSSLSIYHWSGQPVWGGASPGDPTRLYALLNTLNTEQIGNISFYSGSGTGFLGTGTFSSSSTSGGFTEIVPIPEPSIMMATFLLLSCVIISWCSRRHPVSKT